MEKVTTTFWVAVDEDGDAELSPDSADDAAERYNDNIANGVIDIYKIELTVAKPGVQVSTVKIDATRPRQEREPAEAFAVRIDDDD